MANGWFGDALLLKGEKMVKKEKCIFPKMGTKTHQLKKGEKRVDPKKTKKIEKDRKKRQTEWRKWWS